MNNTGLLSSSSPGKRLANSSFFKTSSGYISMAHQPSSNEKNCLGNHRKLSSNLMFSKTLAFPSFLSIKAIPFRSSLFPLKESNIPRNPGYARCILSLSPPLLFAHNPFRLVPKIPLEEFYCRYLFDIEF